MALPTQQLRLNRNQIAAIVGNDPDAVRQFEALFANINTAINELSIQVDQIAAAQAAADAANAAAVAADAAAANADAAAVAAQGTADQVLAESSLANSFTTGLTITATDAGANVTIAMSAHSRVYGDGTTVSVNAGNVTGLAYSTSFWIFYDQVSRLGGAVTYQASTSIQGNGTAPDRHFIGAVLTPAAAAPPTDGNPVRPPGFAEP
jgi:4-hydroxyphenylpyruvate dioxygenase-like putative hemolysin